MSNESYAMYITQTEYTVVKSFAVIQHLETPQISYLMQKN